PPHRGEDGLVGVLDATEGLVGEDDPEAEGVVGGVALPHGDLVVRAELLRQRREVQPAGAATDDRDPHAPRVGRVFDDRQPSDMTPSLAIARSRKRCSLPVPVRGSTSTNSTRRGYLYGAISAFANSCNSLTFASSPTTPGRRTTYAV